MITFPPGFVAIKYPGYFWNTLTKQLYTMKVTGVLRPLVRCKPSYFNRNFDGYVISVEGRRRHCTMEYLNKLVPTDSVIPVHKPVNMLGRKNETNL